MRKRFFFHTITDTDTIFPVKGTDNLLAIKIKGKPYVYHKHCDVKVGDEVMIVRPGTIIHTPAFIPDCEVLNFLPKGKVSPFDQNDTREGRIVRKRNFGKYMTKKRDVDGNETNGEERSHVQSQGVLLTKKEYGWLPTDPEHYFFKHLDSKGMRKVKYRLEDIYTQVRGLSRLLERDVTLSVT
jgi:hypothetical protein